MSQPPISTHEAAHLAAQAAACYTPPISSQMAPIPSADMSSPAAIESSTHSSSLATNHVEYLWNLTAEDIREWLHGANPLFPIKPTESLSLTDEYELIETQRKEQEEYQKNVMLAETMLSNLCLALQSASVDTSPKKTTDDGNPAKRMKIESGAVSSSAATRGRDIYSILDPSFSKGADVIHVPGAIIARLTIGGLMNALAGKSDGIVDTTTARSLNKEIKKETPIASAQNATVAKIQSKAMGIVHIVSARLEVDMMTSTPKRIIEMLCPESTLSDIIGIRKRIYDTVILGRGTNASANAAALERTEDLPVAARTGMHDIDKFKKCKVCGNNEQGSFVLDKKNGDLICTICGTVATESLMHEGTQYRKFEGEEDRNHHGDVANPLYSNAYNMGTSLGGVSLAVGAGVGGHGSGGAKGLETILKNIHNYTEMNISQMGKDEKKTRVGYKDRQKKEAFVQMTHVADALSLHQAVLQRAKELFAGFRDDRELVQQFKGVLAACLCEAFDQLSKDGKQLLKVKAAEDKSEDPTLPKQSLNSRANKRSEMHCSSLAGQGGGFLDTEQNNEDRKAGSTDGDILSAAEKKPASTWTLDESRSWLLEISKSIAKQWHERQKEESKPGSKIKPGSVPKGSLAEMEGKLVQHTLSLCGALEEELKGGAKKGSAFNRKRVVTPRVQEMGRLGIKWQHKHERGSGGAGGIGNNAMRGKQQIGTGRTAGQILFLKTAKKMNQILNDPMSGEAFHRELRSLLSRQEAAKKKELRDDASSQRLNQMKRKPWVQARVNQI